MDQMVLKEFERFLEEQSPESFLRLREALAASPGYAPYEHNLSDVHPLLARGEFARAKTLLLSLMPTHFLSPGAHTMLAFVLSKLGEEKGSNVEFELGERCMAGIISTGTGDRTHPYLVLQISDEYDILDYQSKKTRIQSLVVEGNRAFDCHQCEDGSEVWFDITLPHSVLRRNVEKNH
jgi:hypothetical protein